MAIFFHSSPKFDAQEKIPNLTLYHGQITKFLIQLNLTFCSLFLRINIFLQRLFTFITISRISASESLINLGDNV